MKVGIMQPYFMPYIGYFQLMAAVDVYVIFDDVNYIKRGWSARNNIIVNGQKHLFNISVKGGSQNNLYNQVVVTDDFKKFRKTLEMNYRKAPFFKETIKILDKVFCYDNRRFNYFMKNSYEQILQYIGIEKRFLLSSELANDKQLKGMDKILNICETLEADEYYNAIGGIGLYSKSEFNKKGISLKYVKSDLQPYHQFSKEFIPALSIIDVLMMNSIPAVNKMLSCYQLL